MKTKSIILSIAMIFVALGVSAQTKKATTTETVWFKTDIHCGNCKSKIEKEISFEKGVKALTVNMESETVKVTYDKRKTSVETLIKAFARIEKKATVIPAPEEKKKVTKEKK